MDLTPSKSAVATPVRVGLVARDPLRIEGVRVLLEAGGVCRVLLLKAPRPAQLELLDVVLIDATATEHLFPLLGALLRARPLLRLLVVGEENSLEWTEEVLAAGAHGYVCHASTAAELVRAVDVVREGSVWAPRKVLARLLERARRRRDAEPEAPLLPSRREREVLALLLRGHANKEIGSKLGIDPGTVKSHLSRLMRKAGVSNRTALTMRAMTDGWGKVPEREK